MLTAAVFHYLLDSQLKFCIERWEESILFAKDEADEMSRGKKFDLLNGAELNERVFSSFLFGYISSIYGAIVCHSPEVYALRICICFVGS